MDVAHAILFAKAIDISRVTADYSSAKFEFVTGKTDSLCTFSHVLIQALCMMMTMTSMNKAAVREM